MSFRFWLILIGIIVTLILNVYLIQNEHIEVTAQQEVVESYEDQLADVLYLEPERERNLARFGFDEQMIRKASRQFKRIERYKPQLKAQLKKVEDPVLLAEVFCPRDSSLVRPRYAAVRLLIKEENGKRIVLSPKIDLELIEQDWSMTLPLLDIYESVEKTKEDLPNSTVMVLAALLTKNEDALVRRLEPWGRSLDGSWDWDAVIEKFPKSEEDLIDYVVLMHLMTELANDPEGICQ
jgi:hypothetical protein